MRYFVILQSEHHKVDFVAFSVWFFLSTHGKYADLTWKFFFVSWPDSNKCLFFGKWYAKNRWSGLSELHQL